MLNTSDDDAALLLAQGGVLNGQRWSLKNELVLGREHNCDIVISDRQVSRQHAKIVPSSGGIFLEDLLSKNGTHCNGQKLTEPVKLQDGDVIQIALAQRFVFLSSDATLPLDFRQPLVDATKEYPIEEPESLSRRLKLERQSRRVWIATKDEMGEINEIEISPPLSLAQFRLLEELYINQGRVISRFELISAVWGESQSLEVSVQALDALVRRLRDRLETVDRSHAYIITVRGHGLRLDNPTL